LRPDRFADIKADEESPGQSVFNTAAILESKLENSSAI
jgi:hypothetical protein